MSAPPSARVVVPLPRAADAWLVALSELDGAPVVVRSLRAALALGVPVVVPVTPEVAAGLREVVTGAGLTGVEVVERTGLSPGSLAAETGWRSGDGVPPAAVVVHDPLCPLASPGHLERALAHAAGDPGRAVVAVRPMTDTVKVLHGDRVAGTVDRSRLRVLATPVVVPWAAAQEVPATAVVEDLVDLVGHVGRSCDVAYLTAPPLARRVSDRTDLQIVLGLRDIEEHDAAADPSRG